MKRVTAYAATGTLLASSLLAGSGVTSLPAAGPTPPAAAIRLVAYDSCADALAGLRSAAAASVGPWGFDAGWRSADLRDMTAGPAMRPGGIAAPPPGAPAHSGTNSHEPGADEPDVVKTDGRRIVTVVRGTLRVVDPAARRETGRLDLTDGTPGRWWPEANLLLSGDRALVLLRPGGPEVLPDRPATDQPAAPTGRPAAPPADRPAGPRLVLVDLTGRPTVVGTYRIDGSLLDARQTGPTVRVVVRTQPRLSFPYDERRTDAERTAANRAVIAGAGLDAWLPRYEWTAGTQRHTGRIGCDRLSRPATTTGTALLTVLSFDLTTGRLGDGDPVTVASDADTVYGTAGSLYLAGSAAAGWRPGRPGAGWLPGGAGARRAAPARTDIYRFDTAAPGRPRYTGAGSVPGTLLNQYALSEWQGHLRVATTREETAGSSVHVLAARGDRLVETGRVDGLGRGERITGVRFLGGTGYVVTFRRTDPLHILDLTDPAAPRVTGELKITGWSAYLHPMPGDRLLGVGQEADDRGRAQGLQVSLFDVHDPGRPALLARHHQPYAGSAAEFDPHAFLFDPATGLVSVPLSTGGTLLLRVTDRTVTRIGTVAPEQGGSVTRSLLVDGRLWTLSDDGLTVTDPTTARPLDRLFWS
jgi:hypothetical protein